MTPSEEIDALIARTADWRGERLARLRKVILAADPAIVETWKWMGSPVWERDGILVVGDAHKDKVKLTFAFGAKFPDPGKLFNNGFGGNERRAIDVYEKDEIDEQALTALVRAAIAYNQNKPKKTRAAKPKP